jgi:hypothetical protein
MENPGAFVTGRLDRAAAWLHHPDRAAILPFGPDFYALFCQETPEAMEAMAQLKGRAKNKPFVRATYGQNAAALLACSGIAKTVSAAALCRAEQMLNHVSADRPIAVLLTADTEAGLPARLLGSLTMHGQQRPTVGFIVSGPDSDYSAIIRGMNPPTGVVVGTSANVGGDPRSGGSGHHRISGVVRDFGTLSDMCMFIPARWREGQGPSATTFYIADDGLVAYLIRIGSTSRAEITQILHEIGIEEVRDIDGGAQAIKPYDYRSVRGGSMLLGSIHMLLWWRSRDRDFRISRRFVQMLGACG